MLCRIALALAFTTVLAAGPAAAQNGFSIDHEEIRQANGDQPLEIQFRVQPADRISYAIVYTRTDTEQKFQPTVVRADTPGVFKTTIPGERVKVPSLQYFIRVVDNEGNSHDVFRSAKEPLDIFVMAQSMGLDLSGQVPEQESAFEVEGMDLSGMDALQAEFQLMQVEDVVISASKQAQSIIESPAAIYVITRDDIEGYGFRTLSDALRFVPGMQVYQVNEATSLIGARGFADESNNLVLMLEQGREFNVELFGSPFVENQPYTLDDVERIEVIRGPGSALYGANAFSGVVQVIPKRPQSYEEDYRLYADYDPIVRGQMGQVRAAGVTGPAQFKVSGHYREEYSASDSSDRALRKIATNSKLIFEGVGLPMELGLGVAGQEGDIFTILGESTAEQLEGNINFRTTAGPLRILAYWNHWDARMGISDPELAKILDRVEFRTETLNLDLMADFEFGGINRLTIGANTRWNRFASHQMVEPVSTEVRAGAFLQNEIRPIDQLILSAGVRSDFSTLYQVGEAVGDRLTLSPRGAVIVPINSNHGVRVGAGKAFRKPSFFEQNMRLSAFVPNNLNVANAALENEEILGIDGGYTGRMPELGMRWSVDGFYNQYRNFIAYDGQQFTNEGRDSDSYGGELSLRWKVREDLSAFGNYGLLLITILRPNPLEGTTDREDDTSNPEHSVNFGFRYQPAFGLRLATTVHWESQRTWQIVVPENSGFLFSDYQTEQLGPYATVFAKLGWDFGSWEVGVIGEQIQSDRHNEFPGLDNVDKPAGLTPEPAGERFGGERLPPRAYLYLEGRF